MEVDSTPEGDSVSEQAATESGLTQLMQTELWRDASRLQQLFVDKCESIEKAWKKFLEHSRSYNITISSVRSGLPSTRCGLCLCPTCPGSVTENSLMNNSIIQHESGQYHAPCANFWVNCVDDELPGLAQDGEEYLHPSL